MEKKLQLPDGFSYAYETHLHTSEGSACGRSSGAEMALACKAAGYSGIIVTDHFYRGNTAPDRSLPWEKWVSEFCKGYENAKQVGDAIGLNVMFGWEHSFEGTDFLVYGLDKEWLIAHPEIKDVTIESHYELIHSYGGLVIQAHPFREASYIPVVRQFPKCCDGTETINTGHIASGHKEFNDRALAYAKEYGLTETGGSDIHSVDLSLGGMAFSHSLNNIFDFIAAVKSGEEYVILQK